MPRALKNLNLSLGLASIPVQLFTAASSKDFGFNLMHGRCGTRVQTRLACPLHEVVSRDETVKGYEHAPDEYVRFTPEELKAFEEDASPEAVIDAFVPEDTIDPVYFEETYYLGVGKKGEQGYRVLVEALRQTRRVALGSFTWRGKTTPIAVQVSRDGLVLQRLYFDDEVHTLAEIDMGAAPKIRDQERVLAERLIDELAVPEFRPEKYEDEYRKRVTKAIDQKVAGQEIARVEVAARPATTDLVAALRASLERKPLTVTAPAGAEPEALPEKLPARKRPAS